MCLSIETSLDFCQAAQQAHHLVRRSNRKVMFSPHACFHCLVFLFPKNCEELNTDEDELTSLERFHVTPLNSFGFIEE